MTLHKVYLGSYITVFAQQPRPSDYDSLTFLWKKQANNKVV